MKSLAAKLHPLFQWMDGKSLRERIALFAAVLVVVVFCGNALYFSGQRNRRAEIKVQITALNAALASLESQAEAIRARGQIDPDQEHRVRQRQLQAEMDRLGQRLKDVTTSLI